MKVTIQDADILKNISPQQVETYLITHGWQQQQKIGDKASIWTLGDNLPEAFEILLPLQPEVIDFPRRMGEVLETLALAENRSQIDILSEVITAADNITIQGLVVQIASPNADKLSGEITLLGMVIDKLRPIKIQLHDHEYILAIKAYQERLPVLCNGDLIKDNHGFIIKKIRFFMIEKLNEI